MVLLENVHGDIRPQSGLMLDPGLCAYATAPDAFRRGLLSTTKTGRQIESMLALAEIKPGEKMADLGSGDGRIVIAFAKAGAEAHGVPK